jgi:hypothetical protein
MDSKHHSEEEDYLKDSEGVKPLQKFINKQTAMSFVIKALYFPKEGSLAHRRF